MTERPDPTGYNIRQEGDRWKAIRLVDGSSVGTRASRESAIDLAIKDSDTPGGYVDTGAEPA